jgi:hypothetical protein
MPTFSPQQPIVFPDVEVALAGWLRAVLAPVPVSTRIPNPRPATFLRVMRTGGPRVSLTVDAPQITFEAWANSEQDAHDLAAQVRALVNAAAGQTAGAAQIVKVTEMGGPAWLADPTSSQPRFTWTVQMRVRGTPQL